MGTNRFPFSRPHARPAGKSSEFVVCVYALRVSTRLWSPDGPQIEKRSQQKQRQTTMDRSKVLRFIYALWLTLCVTLMLKLTAVSTSATSRRQKRTANNREYNGRATANRRRDLLLYALSAHAEDLSYLNYSNEEEFLAAYSRKEIHRDNELSLADRTHTLHSAFPPFPESLRKRNLKRLREMFQHSYDSYMIHGYPAAEVRPISCAPGRFDLIRLQALTLIDTLDTLVILSNYTEFARSVERLRNLHEWEPIFDVDQNVSLFETNIRVLGGLLSAHQLAISHLANRVWKDDVFTKTGTVSWGYRGGQELEICPVDGPHDPNCEVEALLVNWNHILKNPLLQVCYLDQAPPNRTRHASYWVYDGYLLKMAQDLGDRLLPAFETQTGIPYGTVNLMNGVPKGETTIASLAGGGTLSLEFELLSRLTQDERYGNAAKLASRALFMRASQLNLFGKHVDVESGQWTETMSGIGSNSDSFLEYLVKHYILFPDDADFWYMFLNSYHGVFNNSRAGEWYVDVDMNFGVQGHSKKVLESLMAFYPGMQVLLGEIAPAARSLNSFFMVREYLGYLPERFNFGGWKVDAGRGAGKHPLRPELLESCYFVHQASKGMISRNDTDSSGWLWAATYALDKLNVSHSPCGYAGIMDLNPHTTGKLNNSDDLHFMDEMPSFFLTETLKYLYLTFDNDNILHTDDDRQWVFTTEAHPIHFVAKGEKKERFGSQVESLKVLLNNKLRGVKKAISTKLSMRDEKWTDKSAKNPYMGKIHDVMKQALKLRQNVKDSSNHERLNFHERRLVSPFVPPGRPGGFDKDAKLDSNIAHLALTNLGIGQGMLLRKACPNVYSSDLFWLHALNGGAVDYSEVYVTVSLDDETHHPNYFTLLGAGEALGMYGSGVYLKPVRENVCPIAFEDTHMDTHLEAHLEPVLDDVGEENEQEPKVINVGTHLGNFRITPFPKGDGFFIEHVDSGESIVTTFLRGAGAEQDFIMTYASFPKEAEDESERLKDESLQKTSVRKLMGAFGQVPADPEAELEDERKVVIGDFQGNSFSCDVEVVEYFEDDDGGGEIVLARYPCAPAMFGSTHIAALKKGDGIRVEATAKPPSDNDKHGCQRELKLDEEGNRRENVKLSSDRTIQFVERGICSFYSKSVNQMSDSDGVVIINDQHELFVMSNGDEEKLQLEPDKVPTTVLMTNLDGLDLLSKLDIDADDEETDIVVRISVSRQETTVDLSAGKEVYFPVLAGYDGGLKVFSRSGWGIQATPVENGGRVEWQINLLRHEATEAQANPVSPA
jgi:mannosidase alpha-like ER degradation enhancer 2